MRKSFIKHILCLLGAVLVLSGCYRDELADIHNQIDDLDLRTIREQIEGMKEGVANLQELQKWIEPAVENLQASKKAIEAEIEDLKALLAEAGAATEELKDELAFKEAQLGNLEKTIAGLESVSAALVERVKELEAAVKAPTTGLSDRVMALETAWQGMATIEELADLEEYATEFSGDFGDNFFKSLEECKQQLSQWVSESTAIQQMFDKYYDCAYLDAEISGLNGVDGTQDASLAEIGTSVSGLKAELQKMINDAINGVADEYESSLEDIENTIKAIQNDIADQYALLWAKIGREDLAIEGTIVSVINTLIERFGTLDVKTGDIDAIVSALRTDLDLFRSDFIKALGGDEYNNETLAGLHALLIELQGKLDGKADDTKVASLIEEAKKLTADVQAALEKYIADNNAALEAYIKKAEQDYLTNAEAEELKGSFALISNLSKLDASITGFDTGEGAFIERGEWDSTVMGLISKLNALVGIGEDGAADKPKQGWTNTIVEAVNDLYVLVNGKLNEAEATEVAIGIVNGFINELLDVKEGGTAGQVKALLDGFADSINILGGSIDTLVEKIGLKDLGAALGDDPDIAIAIARIKSSISGIKEALAGISGNYAGKGHGHDGKDITDLAEAISKEIDAITGKLADLKTTAKETLVAAINELHDKFGGYSGSGKTGNAGVDALLSNLEAVLAAAVRDGGAGLEGYFATLNLSALKSAIDDVVKATTGTIDTRVQAAIDALNLTQYLKDSGIAAYDYVSKKETTVQANLEILSALAALKVTIGEDVFEYGDLDDAIKAVYDALNGHITKYGEITGTYSTIDSRLSSVEDMIGEGFSASNTISSVLGTIAGTADGLDDLFEGLGANQSVKSLTDELRGLFDALINALVGKTSGGSITDIDSSNNLVALKTALDNLNFDTIKKDGKSITDVLKAITDRVGALETKLGTGLGSGLTVIGELNRISAALGDFNYSEFSSWTDSIDTEIKNIIEKLAGSGADLDDLEELIDLLDDITDRLDNFNGVAGNSIEDFMDGLSDDLQVLQNIVGNCKVFGDEFTNIANEIAEFRKAVDSFTIDFSSEGILNALEQIGEYLSCITRINGYKRGTGIYTYYGPSLTDLLGLRSYRDPNLKLLNTSDKSDFVAAVNELFDILAPFVAMDEYLNDLKAAIIPEGCSYTSLKAIAAVYETLAGLVGDKTKDFSESDIWSAIAALDDTTNSLKDALGTNSTEYPTVWAAIDNLRTLFAARFINSLVYIPEYDDGKATAVSDGSVFTVEMDFRVNAPASLADVLSAGKLPVKGLLKTPGAGVGTEINGNATYSNGVLSVSLFGKGSISEGSSIAVVLGSVANGIMSQYIPIHISNSGSKIARIKSADPASGTTFKFLAGIGGSRSIKFTPVNELDDLADITVNESITNVDVKGNGLVWTIEASSNISTRNTGKIYFPDNFTYQVEVSTVMDILKYSNANLRSSYGRNYFTVGYNTTVTLDFGDLSEYGLSGSLDAVPSAYKPNSYSSNYDNLIKTIRCEGGKVIFETESRSWNNQGNRITVKIGDVILLDGLAILQN